MDDEFEEKERAAVEEDIGETDREVDDEEGGPCEDWGQEVEGAKGLRDEIACFGGSEKERDEEEDEKEPVEGEECVGEEE